MGNKIIVNIIDELAKVESEVNMEIGVEIYDRSTGKDKIILEGINKIIGKCIDDINKIYCGKSVEFTVEDYYDNDLKMKHFADWEGHKMGPR